MAIEESLDDELAQAEAETAAGFEYIQSLGVKLPEFLFDTLPLPGQPALAVVTPEFLCRKAPYRLLVAMNTAVCSPVALTESTLDPHLG